MLRNFCGKVKTNLASEGKKFAVFSDSIDSSFVSVAESTLSSSFSANTEDISFTEIQGFEANFLGKSEVFSKNTDSCLLKSNHNNSSQHNPSDQLGKYFISEESLVTAGRIKFSNQSDYFAFSSSVLRCLADQRVIANNNDSASFVSDFASTSAKSSFKKQSSEDLTDEEQLLLPGFSSAEFYSDTSNFSSSSNFSEYMNLPDERVSNISTFSDDDFGLKSLEPANQFRYRPSEMSKSSCSGLLNSGDDLISEASSAHLLKMINCLTEEAEVSKLAQSAKDEEIQLLRREVDHLKQASHAILMYLDALQKREQNRHQRF